MSPLPPIDRAPRFSLLARPAGRTRLGLMQAILAVAGAILAVLAPFALVIGAAMLSAAMASTQTRCLYRSGLCWARA